MDLNFGVVGYGAWGAHHADTISKTPGARLISLQLRPRTAGNGQKRRFPLLKYIPIIAKCSKGKI